MKLTYVPVRGRAEAILLLLIDSGMDYEHEVITGEEWQELKRTGQAGPPRFPFSATPTLTFGHGARGGGDTVLGEESAILIFLTGKMQPTGTVASPPDAIARIEMVRSASSFLLSRLFALAASPDWLSPSSRKTLLKNHILPYLTSLSYHLSSSFFPPLLTPPLTNGRPGTSLSAAAASACVTVSFIEEIFPNTLGGGPNGGMKVKFPHCEDLRTMVEDRPRIKAWIESGKRETRWSLWPSASEEFIKEQAKYDVEEEFEKIEGEKKKEADEAKDATDEKDETAQIGEPAQGVV